MRKIILLFILFTSILKSQSDDNHHRKYWYYKTRLNNDFVKVGTGQGESMPFNQRGLGFFRLNNGTFNGPLSHKLALGDGTSTMGMYLAVLATEWKLLKNNNQDTKKTEHELFCALNAINRLDYNAEAVWRGYVNPTYDLNGFFIRDDIDQNFVPNNYKHFNYYINGGLDANNNPLNIDADRGFCSTLPNGINETNSDYQNWQASLLPGAQTPNNTNFAMSQDQIYALFVGLASIATLMPQGITDEHTAFGGSGQDDLAQEARIITKRITDFVKNSNNFSCGSNPWLIWIPIFPCTAVQRGPNAEGYAYPLSQAACFIYWGTDLPTLNTTVIPVNCGDFNDNYFAYNLAGGYPVWNALDVINGGATANEVVFYHHLADVCHCIYGATNILNVTSQHLVDNASVDIVSGFPHTSLGSELYHSPYLHDILHNTSRAWLLNTTMNSLLDDAPCGGTYNFSAATNLQDWGNIEWSSGDRFEHTDNIGKHSGYFSGEYNGLDYMLYHNVYYLYNYINGTSGVPDYKSVNLSERIIHFALPASTVNNTIGDVAMPSGGSSSNNGSKSQPATVGAFETIEADNTISSNADITYRAGKYIHLTHTSGNFNVQGGAIFHATVQPYICANNDYQRTTSQNDTTKHVNYSDNSMYEVATHSVVSTETSSSSPKKNNSYSKNSGSKTDLTSAGIEIFPNPGTGLFTVEAQTLNTSMVSVSVLDINGKQVLFNKFPTQIGANNFKINLNDENPGVYYFNINDENGTKLKAGKLVIIR